MYFLRTNMVSHRTNFIAIFFNYEKGKKSFVEFRNNLELYRVWINSKKQPWTNLHNQTDGHCASPRFYDDRWIMTDCTKKFSAACQQGTIDS